MSAAEIPDITPDPIATDNSAVEPPIVYSGSYTTGRASTPASIGRWLGRTRLELKARMRTAYAQSRDTTASAVRKLRNQGQRIRQERPLPVLAVISGSAFALGITLAVIRSRRK